MLNRKIASLKVRAKKQVYNQFVYQGLFEIKIPSQSSVHYQVKAKNAIENLIAKKLMPKLLQAIVNNDQETVISLLKANPQALLLASLPLDFVVECKENGKKFYAENPLTTAVQCKQIAMVELILSYYCQFEQTEEESIAHEIKVKALSNWKSYKIQDNKIQDNKIVIPKYYLDYAQSLMNTLINDPFTNNEISETTKFDLSFLRNNILFPDAVITLKNYVDVNLLLLAACSVYAETRNFNNLLTWKKRDTFCILVIGLIQSALNSEFLAKFKLGFKLAGQLFQPEYGVSLNNFNTNFYPHYTETKILGVDFVYNARGKIDSAIFFSRDKMLKAMHTYLCSINSKFELIQNEIVSYQAKKCSL